MGCNILSIFSNIIIFYVLTGLSRGHAPVYKPPFIISHPTLPPHCSFVKFSQYANLALCLISIVAKKWDPGILDPGRFSAQIRKVEARLGKFAKIRKVETNLESSSKRLGKLEVRPKRGKEKVLT